MKSRKTFIVATIMVVLSILNFFYVEAFARFFVSTLYTIICAKAIFSDKMHKVITAGGIVLFYFLKRGYLLNFLQHRFYIGILCIEHKCSYHKRCKH